MRRWCRPQTNWDAVASAAQRRRCCLLVLNLVTSTPQWIRRLVRPRDLCVYTRPRPGLRGLCLYVNVCSNVLGSCGLCTFGYVSPSTLTFALRLVQLIFAAVATSAPPGLSAALPLPSLLRSPLCTHNMTTKLTTNLTILTKPTTTRNSA